MQEQQLPAEMQEIAKRLQAEAQAEISRAKSESLDMLVEQNKTLTQVKKQVTEMQDTLNKVVTKLNLKGEISLDSLFSRAEELVQLEADFLKHFPNGLPVEEAPKEKKSKASKA